MSVPPRRPLNPDEILSEGDMPGYYVNGQWIAEGDDAASKLTAEQKSASRGILHRIVYADGRVETWLRNPGQDAQKSGSKITVGALKDPEAVKEWDRRVEEANKREEANAPKSPDTQSETQKNEAVLNEQRRRNAALPGPNPEGATEAERRGQDPRYETDQERAERADRVIKEQGAEATRQATAAAANAPTVTSQRETRNGKEYLIRVTTPKPVAGQPLPPPTIEVFDDTGKAVAGGLPVEAGKPNTLQVKGGDGKTYIVPIGTDGKPGTPTALDVPGTGPQREDKPYVDKKTGKQLIQRRDVDATKGTDRTYYVDPATGQEVTLDESSNIKGVPSYTPDLTKPGAGLIERAKQLDELMAAGTITYEQRQEVLKNDQVLTSAVANQFNTGVAILREDYQNQTTQRNADVGTANTRLQISNQHMENALGFVGKFMKYLGQTDGDAGRLFTGLLATQVAHATAMGGLKDVPREHMDPNLINTARAWTGGAGVQPTPTTPPNAIGAGAVPDAITPGAPAAPAAFNPDQFDMGPNGPMPRELTPSSSYNAPIGQANPALQRALGLAPAVQPDVFDVNGMANPENNSWRQQALNRESMNLGESLVGSSPFQIEQPQQESTPSMFEPLPMVLDSSILGLTPEMDAQAKREIDMAIAGGHY